MGELETGDQFVSVTELAGDEVSREQLQRICTRYYWAGQYCEDKDVFELACGTGQGLGYLNARARSVRAGDISPEIVAKAKTHYQNRVDIQIVDAHNIPCEDQSLDVLILFEAIYYLEDIKKFFEEAKRVLRQDGKLLIATANKDLYDFNPSPFSKKYYGVEELTKLLEEAGFKGEFYGNIRLDEVSLRQRVLRPVKKIATTLHLVPETMAGKKLLKSIVFGKLVSMPPEITGEEFKLEDIERIPEAVPDTRHKVILCAATKQSIN